MPAWDSNTSKGPARNGVSMRATRRRFRDLIAVGSPDAARQLLKGIKSEDERVSIIAIKEWREALFGKSQVFEDEDEGNQYDFSNLTDAEAEELAVAVATIDRLTHIARSRLEAAETITVDEAGDLVDD